SKYQASSLVPTIQTFQIQINVQKLTNFKILGRCFTFHSLIPTYILIQPAGLTQTKPPWQKPPPSSNSPKTRPSSRRSTPTSSSTSPSTGPTPPRSPSPRRRM